MSAMSRRKGARWEADVVTWLRQHWPHVERRIMGMAGDHGDFTGMGPGVVIEAKNQAQFDLAGWVDQLEAEIAECAADTGVVIVKRRGRPSPGDGYALMTVDRWAALMREAGRCQ